MFQTNGKTFPKNYLSTSGVDLAVKVVNIPDTDTAVELYIHDCAGSELHRQMMPAVVRADARCLIVRHSAFRFTLVFLLRVARSFYRSGLDAPQSFSRTT
jgi:hypothetical protein